MWKPEADIGIIIDDSSTVPSETGCQSNLGLAENTSLASQLVQRTPVSTFLKGRQTRDGSSCLLSIYRGAKNPSLVSTLVW